MAKLNGKIAVVTGGNSGIGLATARSFVAEGASVIITGRRRKELNEAVSTIGSNIDGFQGDIANYADIENLRDYVGEKYGRIDILFANAGVVGQIAPLGKVTSEHFEQVININVKGTFFTVQALLPLIVDGGSIILTSSIAATKGLPGMSVYSGTKAFLRSLVQHPANKFNNYRAANKAAGA